MYIATVFDKNRKPVTHFEVLVLSPHGRQTEGIFVMPAKKGQTFNRYSEETKKEAVRLRVEEGWAYSRIMEKFGIKCESQIITWVRKSQNGESFEDYRERWTKKHFSSAEEEMLI